MRRGGTKRKEQKEEKRRSKIRYRPPNTKDAPAVVGVASRQMVAVALESESRVAGLAL